MVVSELTNTAADLQRAMPLEESRTRQFLKESKTLEVLPTCMPSSSKK